MMSDTYGPMYEMPLAQYDPDTQSWKTSEVTSLWALPMSSLTLPAWGGMRGGELFEHPTPERPTVAPDCSSLPTPHAGLGERGRDGVYPNPKGQQDLQHALAYLPTPKAGDGERGRDLPRLRWDTAGRELSTTVGHFLPTPKASNNENQQNLTRYGPNLGMAVMPDQYEWIGASMPQQFINGSQSSDELRQPQLFDTRTATD